jgi:hypothetical protein
MDHNHDDLNAELLDVAAELRAHRPEATALELDTVKRRVIARAGTRREGRGSFMRSRLAILAMLVLGFGLSTTGAGLAVTGFATSNDASVAQYGNDNNAGTGNGGGGNNQVLGESNQSGTPDQGVVAGQVAATSQGSSGNSLPFTGFAAIPVLLIGVALLGSGLVARRASRDH